MDRSQLNNFQDSADETRFALYGETVSFRGELVDCLPVSGDAEREQGRGGTQVKRIWTVRFAKSLQPPPREDEFVKRLDPEIIYKVTGCHAASQQSAKDRFHIVTLEAQA